MWKKTPANCTANIQVDMKSKQSVGKIHSRGARPVKPKACSSRQDHHHNPDTKHTKHTKHTKSCKHHSGALNPGPFVETSSNMFEDSDWRNRNFMLIHLGQTKWKPKFICDPRTHVFVSSMSQFGRLHSICSDK